jgi:dihydrofolate reductase
MAVCPGMSTVICHIAISADGFVAGPNQSAGNPIGEGGLRLHEWHIGDHPQSSADGEASKAITEGHGAFIMGRNMFDPGRGEWDQTWNGWWGDNPPYHAPTYVLTHHPRESVVMEGGTTFHFVTDGIKSALKQARAAAGDKSVAVAGGARTVQQFIKAGLLDELHLHIAPVILGAGERLLENIGDPALEPVKVTSSPLATHVTYRLTYS